jgi:hypothetical protein
MFESSKIIYANQFVTDSLIEKEVLTTDQANLMCRIARQSKNLDLGVEALKLKHADSKHTAVGLIYANLAMLFHASPRDGLTGQDWRAASVYAFMVDGATYDEANAAFEQLGESYK